MEETLFLDAVERMVAGTMSAQEKQYFDELRRNNPELDQKVVEHLFFLHQLETFRNTKSFKHNLAEVQTKLVEEGLIKKSELPLKAKVINMWTRYKRVVAVAASIAGLVSIFVASIVSAVNTRKNSSLTPLVNIIEEQKEKIRQTEKEINKIKANIANDEKQGNQRNTPIIDAKFRATGFLIDAANKYIVTNAHVVSQAKNHLIIENSKGIQFLAKAIYVDNNADLAIVKVTDSAFTKQSPLPYSIRRNNAELGEQIFMLGYPKQEIVYNEGYISAKNGYQMDSLYCQLSTDANEGSSGSPVINKNGEIIGIVTSKETNSLSTVYAIKSINIHRAVEEAKKADSSLKIKLAGRQELRGLNREDQIRKVEDYVFMVKGN